MRTIFYHDFNKEPSFQREKIRSKFLNAYRHKLKIKVRMFDCLAGLGHGYTEDGQKVYLNAYNIITPECYLGLLPDEEILADVEIMKDKELFARNIERNIKELKRKRDLIRDVYMTTYPTDELGCELDSTATFEDLYQALLKHKDVYTVMGCEDSLMRDRLFNILGNKYTDESVDEIFHLWFGY